MADLTLEQVLADTREEAAVLRRAGHVHEANAYDRICDQVQRAAEDYLTFVSESDARLISGRSVEWLRGRFPEWLDRGLARLNGKRREYRMVVLPRRANVLAAREAGRRAALEEGNAA